MPRLALSAAARLDSCSSTINMSTGFSLGSFSLSVAHVTLSTQQWHTTSQKKPCVRVSMRLIIKYNTLYNISP